MDKTPHPRGGEESRDPGLVALEGDGMGSPQGWRQSTLPSPELWNCLIMVFSEPTEKPQATMTGSASGKKLMSESACSLSVPIQRLAQPCLQAIHR